MAGARGAVRLDPGVAGAVELARRALADNAEWLVVSADSPPPGARSLQRWSRFDLELPAHEYTDVLRSVSWTLLTPLINAVSRERRLIELDWSSLAMQLPDADSTEPSRVWWASAQVSEVIDPVDAYRQIAESATSALTPLVEAARSRVRMARRTLWGYVLESFLQVGPDCFEPCDDTKLNEWRLVERGIEGTRLAQPVRTVDLFEGGERFHLLVAPSCCLEYQQLTPGPGQDKWSTYCLGCPRVPPKRMQRMLGDRKTAAL
jgi:hypothetical protein